MTLPGQPALPEPGRRAPSDNSPSDLLGAGTLGRQLLIRVVVLVAAVALAMAAVTTVAMSQTVLATFDRSLHDAFARQQSWGAPMPGESGVLELSMGQPVGTVVVEATDRGVRGGVLAEGQVDPLTLAAAQTLLAEGTDHPRTVTLPGYGRYRIVAQQGPSGTYAVGLPMDRTDATIRRVLLVEALLAVLALGIATIVVRQLVLRSIRPLHQVAETATTVSELDLSHGDAAMPVRVPDTSLDPRNEVDQVATALNRMLGHVEEALVERQASETKVRRFVADASHELRNPLASIRGYAELTKPQRPELPQNTAHALTRVEAEAERMSQLVEDLLLLARMDADPNLTLESVDVRGIVADATADAQAAGPDHDWEVDLPDEDSPALVRADRHRLHQVVANLLTNARQHTPAGTSVVASVGVGVGQPGDGPVTIAVTDNGPGIPADEVDKVFERFTRADVGRSRSGATRDSTGLGLAIVAAVVAAHDGTVRVESQPGRTRFSIELPRHGAGR